MLTGRRTWVVAALLCLVLQGPPAGARNIQDPWGQLPADAKPIIDPAALTVLLADRTVRAIYLPDGTEWREFSAADGRTVWDFGGCLHPGTWRVSGSAVCYVYPTWDDGRPQCFMVYQSGRGTHLVWLDPATGDQWLISQVVELAPGNPDRLPLDGAPGCDDPAV